MVETLRKDHCRGEDRPGEGAPARLVAARLDKTFVQMVKEMNFTRHTVANLHIFPF